MSHDSSYGGIEQVPIRLLRSERGDEVRETIDQLMADDAFTTEWPTLSEDGNEFSVIENQGDAEHALAEIYVNSVDADLGRAFYDANGTDADFADAGVQSYEEAAEEFDLEDRFVRCIADGDKEDPNMIVADNGIGQSNDTFENTFCKLFTGGSKKQGIPFMQGQFGLGGHASVSHCGDSTLLEGHGYKLIISAAHTDPGQWSWTIIRRNPDDPSTFEYLRIDGEIPQFTGDLEVPADDNTFTLESGTVVKLYEYQIDQPTRSITHTLGLRGNLSKYLVDTIIDFEMFETREDASGFVSRSVVDGVHNAIDTDRPEVIDHFTTEKDVEHPDIDHRAFNIYLFHPYSRVLEDDDMSLTWYRRFATGDDSRILLTINGETHASFDKQFLEYHCDLKETASDILVTVDLSDIGWKTTAQMFNFGRDRGSDNDPRYEALIEATIDILANHSGLREEEARRRAAQTEEADENMLRDALETLTERNPEAADFLGNNDLIRVSLPGDENEDDEDDVSPEELDEYDREESPTHLRPISRFNSRADYDVWPPADPDSEATADESFRHFLGVEKGTRLQFECNAPNDYFATGAEPGGDLTIHTPSDCEFGADDLVSSYELSNGILTLSLRSAESLPGELPDETVIVRITRPEEESLMREVTLDSEEKPDYNSTPADNGDQIGYKLSCQPDLETLIRIDDHDDLHVTVNTGHNVLMNFLDKHSIDKDSELGERITHRWAVFHSLHAVFLYTHVKDTEVIDTKATQHVEESMDYNAFQFEMWAFDDDELSDLKELSS